MSADFSRAWQHLTQGVINHAWRDYPGDDGPSKIRRAAFIDRGGHAPGQRCPTGEWLDPHYYMCQHPDDECSCHLYGHTPDPDPVESPHPAGADTAGWTPPGWLTILTWPGRTTTRLRRLGRRR